MEATFTVENYSRFSEKLQELQRKAKRHDLTVPVITAHTQENITKWVNDWKIIIIEHTITVEFENLAVDTGKLIAQLNHTENIINTVPGESLPKQYLHSTPKCDHCQYNRQRTDTFVIQLPDGTYMQLGRNCLALYLGIDVEKCLYIADLAAEISSLDDDDYKSGNYSTFHFDLGYTLALTCHTLTQNGYASKKTALETGKPATSSIVMDLYLDNMNGKNKVDVTPYTDTVNKVIAYMLSLESSQQEYELNLFNIATNNIVSLLTMGYTVSAVNSYNRHVAKQLEQQKKSLADVGHFGKINDKFTPKNLLTATVIRVSAPIETSYGYGTSVKQWYTMQNNAGYIFTWFTDAYKVNLNDTITLTGCIAEHTVYSGISQTVLKNCRIK